MVDLHHGAPAAEIGVLCQVVHVQHRAGGDVRLAQDVHGLVFRVLPGPRRDEGVQLLPNQIALLGGLHPGVGQQLLVADDLRQALELGAAGVPGAVDMHIVVVAEGLAGIHPRRGHVLHGHAVARPQGHLAPGEVVGLPVGPAEADAGILHVHLDALAQACVLPLEQGGADAHGGHIAHARIPHVHSRLAGDAVGEAGHGGHAAGGLADGGEGGVVREGAVHAEALHLGIDEPGVNFLQYLVTQAQALHAAGAHVLHEYVRLRGQLFQKGQALRRLGVAGDGFLVQVQQDEAEAVLVRGNEAVPALFPLHRPLHLPDLRPHPSQGLRADGARLELGHVQDLHSRQGPLSAHASFPPSRQCRDSSWHASCLHNIPPY